MSDTLFQLLDRMQNENSKQRLDDLPSEKRWRSIPRDAGEFLGVMVRATKSKQIVEIGTSQGYSTIWLGMAAKSIGGHVTSFEIEEWRYKAAVENIKVAGLEDTVTLHLIDPLSNLNLVPNEIDMLFLDAEKADYHRQIKSLFEKIKFGGVIIADNIVSHFAEVREYIEFVRNDPNLNSVLFSSVGSGLELTYKLTETENSVFPWSTLVR